MICHICILWVLRRVTLVVISGTQKQKKNALKSHEMTQDTGVYRSPPTLKQMYTAISWRLRISVQTCYKSNLLNSLPFMFFMCVNELFVFVNSNCPLREDWSSSNITLPPPLFRRTIVGRHDHVFIQTVHRRLYSIINCWWSHYNAQRKNVLLTTVVSLSYKK